MYSQAPEPLRQTSADVLRDIKGIKKKLAAIDELKQKIKYESYLVGCLDRF
jgi:hypothetical protein